MSRFFRSNRKATAETAACAAIRVVTIPQNARDLRDSFGPVCAWRVNPF